MIGRRAVVVTDSDGVLEVFGPYGEESDALSAAKSDLELWAIESEDTSVELVDMPLRDPVTLDEWIHDPEGFYVAEDGVEL